MLELRAYLDNVEISLSDMPDLWVDRQGLQAALSLDRLIQSAGRTWDSLTQEIAGFKSNYGAAYRLHHVKLHQDLPAYQRGLEAARRKIEVLDLVNSIPELTNPEGLGLAESLAKLEDGPAPCPVDGEGLRLEENPYCATCEITLEQILPLDALDRIDSALDSALAIKCKGLSDLLVGKIMQNTDDPDLDDLIRMVQTSDLKSLCNTMNQDMVDFISQLLA